MREATSPILQERGDEPVRDFLRALPKAARIVKRARALIDLEESGPRLRRSAVHYLCDGIYELRFSSQRVQYRILYFFDGVEVVLTNAFVKKTSKVPREGNRTGDPAVDAMAG